MFSGFSTPSDQFRVLPEPVGPEGVRPVSEDTELAAILQVADPGPLVLLSGRGGPTFVLPPSAGSDVEAAAREWRGWQTRIFQPLVAPALVRASICAGWDNARELRAGDLALAEALPPGGPERAGEPGRRLLHRLRSARGVRWVARLQTWAAAGEIPALFPTVFAGHCALFHVPPRTMLLAYAACEWRAAVGPGHGSRANDAAAGLEAALAVSRPAVDGTLAALARDRHAFSPVRPTRGQ